VLDDRQSELILGRGLEVTGQLTNGSRGSLMSNIIHDPFSALFDDRIIDKWNRLVSGNCYYITRYGQRNFAVSGLNP